MKWGCHRQGEVRVPDKLPTFEISPRPCAHISDTFVMKEEQVDVQPSSDLYVTSVFRLWLTSGSFREQTGQHEIDWSSLQEM